MELCLRTQRQALGFHSLEACNKMILQATLKPKSFLNLSAHSIMTAPYLLSGSLLLLFSHYVVSDSFATPRTIAHYAHLSMGFSRQEYWIGLPFPSPGDLPDSGIEPTSPALAGRFFTTELVIKEAPQRHGGGKFIPQSEPSFPALFTCNTNFSC